MRTNLRGLAPAALVLLIAVPLTSCGSSGSSAGTSKDAKRADVQSGAWGSILRPGGTPKRGGTLIIDQFDAPSSASAYRMMEDASTLGVQVTAQLFDQLVEYLPGHFDPQPGLATSWEISDDGLTYTFHLRPGVKFSNGMDFTSEDVKFMLDHGRGPKSLFKEFLYGVVKRVDTPDPLTAVVHLSNPSPGFIWALGNIAASIPPKKLIQQIGVKAYDRHPVGTGAFMMESWKPGEEMVFVRNPTYWRKGLPYLDKVILRAVTNDNTRVLNVTSGNSDIADAIPFTQFKTVEASGRAKVLTGAGGDFWAIFPNCARKPFDEVAVRQALNYATPKDAINKVAFAGTAPIMTTMYPKMRYWDKDVKGYGYDLEKAKALLAKSSVPNGFSTTFTITGNNQPSNQLAQIVQQAWAKIGVKVTIRRMDNAALSDKWTTGQTDLAIFNPGQFATDVPVDDEFATLFFNSPELQKDWGVCSDPAGAKITAEATSTIDEGKRQELFTQLQEATNKNAPFIPIVYTPNRAAVSNAVHGFNYMMAGTIWRLELTWKE